MTSGSFSSVSRPRNRRKSQSARLRVLASQSEVALDRSETFLRNQDPNRTLAICPEMQDLRGTMPTVRVLPSKLDNIGGGTQELGGQSAPRGAPRMSGGPCCPASSRLP